MNDGATPSPAPESREDQREVRVQKLARLRDAGINPYPERFDRTHLLAEAQSLPPGTKPVRVSGRLMTVRVMGKLSFATLSDVSGRCQISVQRDDVGEAFYRDVWKKLIDLGDFVGVEGEAYVTNAGEPTIRASSITFLGKTLRPLPEKWHGLSDRETCYRQRYLDLAMNRETLERFLLRSRIVKSMRTFLEEHRFVEIDTPALAPKASGAAARPFKSRHHALDMEVFLRIAPETYLKRAVVGGFDRVFEFARCFRNEGMDPSHLQDFTMLEWYAAYWNYEDNMRFTQALVQHVVRETLGTTRMTLRGREVDFGGEWPRYGFRDLILRDAGIDIDAFPDADALRAEIRRRGVELEDVDDLGRGNLIDQLYKKVSRPKLVGPAFLTEHPVDLSPLARRNDARPQVCDRFQLVVAGWEIVNAYSELVDPLDQRRRFEEQARLKESGDEEAMDMDEDYLLAMEHGMPPMSGFGLGIDRFCCLLSDQDNLRDVVLFPLMRPRD
ncbi:MAG TPA: lysine--tRNA ligase [Planctomycetota bacterium]|nr:lysine--tRNA ligase [Planctomycetota bacterium]